MKLSLKKQIWAPNSVASIFLCTYRIDRGKSRSGWDFNSSVVQRIAARCLSLWGCGIPLSVCHSRHLHTENP